ncbi:MAG: N-formylglutamate deformylase [Bacteroidetes bacterium]|nr:MAG: N-formylglutamate deformylase [Bacteroidota bacterium]
MTLFTLTPGDRPLLVSLPHAGLYVPPEIRRRFTEPAQALPDTDWHVDRLYDRVLDLGVSVLAATHSRNVIDLNRPPDDTPLYAGATTGLCPLTLFDGTPLYRPGLQPDAAERQERLHRYWEPYHQALAGELARLRDLHGFALLLDAHSIRPVIPRLFEGVLPDLNLGTNDGRSAAPSLIRRAEDALRQTNGYTYVRDGRFKGGYITRHYGTPDTGIHALQLELAQTTYMDDGPPFAYHPERADRLRGVLHRLVATLLTWTPDVL